MPEPRLSRDFLSARRVGREAGFQLRPGEVFPIDILESDGSLTYVPVPVTQAWRDRERARSRAVILARAPAYGDERAAVEHIRKTVEEHGEAFQCFALFYLLGYDIDLKFLIDAHSAEPFDSLLDRWKIRNPFVRIRAVAYLAPGRLDYIQTLLDRRDARMRTEEFQQEVVVPAMEVEAIVIREVALFYIGGEVLELALEGSVRVGAWIFEWLTGMRYQFALFKAARALMSAGGTGVEIYKAVTLAREMSKFLIPLGMLGMTVRASLPVGAEILGKFLRILDFFLDLHLHEKMMAEKGGVSFDGWVSSPDPSEDRFLDYLQAQMDLGGQD